MEDTMLNRKTLFFPAMCAVMAAGIGRSVPVWSAPRGGDAPRTLSLDSGYLPFFATPRAGANLWKEYEGLGSYVFDLVSEGTPIGSNFLTRALWAAGATFGWRYANYPFFVGNHELGHGSRGVAAGGSPRYSWTGGAQHTSIFTFIADGYARYGSGAQTATSWTLGPSDWTTQVSAAGMNASMQFLERLQDDAFYHRGHAFEGLAYFLAATDAYYYANSTDGGFSGDVSTLISNWSGIGVNVSTSDFRTGSLIALAASASTYAYALAALRYVAVGDPTVRGLSVGPVRLPDVSFYSNRGGISYKVRSQFQMSPTLSLPVSVEVMAKGASRIEGSVGVRASTRGGRAKHGYGAFQLHGLFNTGGGLGARLVHEQVLGPSFLLTVGSGIYLFPLLEGERTVDRLISSLYGFDAWARLSAVF